MTTKTITTYSIAIHADNVWAGTGIYDHTDSGDTVSGDIRDCGAILGGDQDTAEKIYDAITDAITDMDDPDDGEIEYDGVTYSWCLPHRGVRS